MLTGLWVVRLGAQAPTQDVTHRPLVTPGGVAPDARAFHPGG